MLIQPDGKILFVIGDEKRKVARLNADGSLDTTFQASLPSILRTDLLLLQPDGKILLKSGSAITRFNPDGSNDATFTGFAVNEFLLPVVALQADGKIVVANPANDTGSGANTPALVRLNRDGTLDGSFSPTLVGWDNTSNRLIPINRIEVQPDQKILISGEFRLAVQNPGDYLPQYVLARLLPDGSLDPTFSAFQNGPVLWHARLRAVQTDGKLLVTFPGLNFVQRLNEDGSRDATFQESTNPAAQFLVAMNDGVLLFSDSSAVDGLPLIVTKLNLDGSHQFRVSLPLADEQSSYPAPYGSVSAVATDSSGRIIVGGQFTAINGVARVGITRLFPGTLGPVNCQLTASTAGASENSRTVSLVVQRTGDTGGEVAVDYSTADGSAIGGIDYLSQQGTLRFVPLQTVKTITVPIFDNALPNLDKSFQLRLSNPSGGATVDAGPSVVTVSIADDERPGSVDASFDAGLATGEMGEPVSVATYAPRGPLLQPDGKAIISLGFDSVPGSAREGNFGFVRLNSDGSLDPSFALPAVEWEDCSHCGEVTSLFVQPDGKLLMGGQFTTAAGVPRTNLVRLNMDGTVDATFADSPELSPYPFPLGVGKDGTIIFGGKNVIALHSDGSLAYDAKLVIPGAWDSSTWIRTALLEPDGGLLISGGYTNIGGVPKQGPARLKADGSLDPTFQAARCSFAAIQPDGKIIATYYYNEDTGQELPLVRLNPDGSLDNSFNTDLPELIYVRAVALQSDGKVLVSATDGWPTNNFLVRLNPNGSHDATFVANVSGRREGVTKIIVAANGQILLAGDFTTVNGLPRLGVAQLNSGFNPPRFTRFEHEANGFRTIIASLPGQTYILEASTNLIDWLLVHTNKAASSTLEFADGNGSLPLRFYRAVKAGP
jgi:uncharacterized delta-60 repeat protein